MVNGGRWWLIWQIDADWRGRPMSESLVYLDHVPAVPTDGDNQADREEEAKELRFLLDQPEQQPLGLHSDEQIG